MLGCTPRSGRRRAGAFLVSLVAHGLLVAVLLRSTAPPTTAPPQAIEIELRAPEPPVEPPPPALVGPPAPAPPAPARPERHASAPAAPLPPPSRPAAAAPESTPPTESPSLLRMRPPTLTLDGPTVERFSREGVITAPPTPAPAGAGKPGKSKWQEKLAMVERDGAGRQNVAEGKVHPQIFDLMRTAEKIFTPRESVVEKDDRAPNTFGRSVKSWTRGFFRNYLDQLRQLEESEPSRKSALSEGGSDVIAEYNRLLRAAEKGAESIACQVCLVVRPGLPPEIVLAKGSGNNEIDQAAVDALTRAAARRALDNDLRPQRACYRFAASIHRIPPLPIVGCNFDESAMRIGCYYPGKQIFQLKVSLDLVDYGG
jgi:hypothetical protein